MQTDTSTESNSNSLNNPGIIAEIALLAAIASGCTTTSPVQIESPRQILPNRVSYEVDLKDATFGPLVKMETGKITQQSKQIDAGFESTLSYSEILLEKVLSVEHSNPGIFTRVNPQIPTALKNDFDILADAYEMKIKNMTAAGQGKSAVCEEMQEVHKPLTILNATFGSSLPTFWGVSEAGLGQEIATDAFKLVQNLAVLHGRAANSVDMATEFNGSGNVKPSDRMIEASFETLFSLPDSRDVAKNPVHVAAKVEIPPIGLVNVATRESIKLIPVTTEPIPTSVSIGQTTQASKVVVSPTLETKVVPTTKQIPAEPQKIEYVPVKTTWDYLVDAMTVAGGAAAILCILLL